MSKPTLRFIDPDKDRSVFFATLRGRVEDYFKSRGLSKHCNRAMVLKSAVLFIAYIGPYFAIVFSDVSFLVALLFWSVMGFALAGIGMSVMHDANHGAYSRSAKVNYWLGHSLNLLGGSVFNWKMQHNLLHHTYTNVIDMDEDIDDKLILRFSPHTRVRWYHRFQFIYAFFFYGILTLYWTLLKDFVQFSRYAREGVNNNSPARNRVVMLKIVMSKVAYFAAFLFIPILAADIPAWEVVTGFLLMHFIGGVVLTVIFQLAHTVEGTTYPLPGEDNVIENNWAIHQLNTTVNFSRNNRFLTWYLGGLNYQVEHHLFPTICHVHYPAISAIVKSTCSEFGVSYLETEGFGQALISHIRTLKRFGGLPGINDAIA